MSNAHFRRYFPSLAGHVKSAFELGGLALSKVRPRQPERRFPARRPRITVSDDGQRIVSHAGALLLTETARVTAWPRAGPVAAAAFGARPGQDVLDLAVAVAFGGNCLADADVLRAEPALFRAVASDPVISQLVTRLAADAPAALKAMGQARAAARARAWQLADGQASGSDGGLIPVNIDATIVTAHSDKEQAAPTWNKAYGFHPLTVFADHGPDGSGEPLAIMLRPGNAGSNTAADHIAATNLALAQLQARTPRRVLVRTDSGGGTHELVAWLTKPGRRFAYSVGFTTTDSRAARHGAHPTTAISSQHQATDTRSRKIEG
jgi:Transposase DDE domain group 1